MTDISSIDAVQSMLGGEGYICDRALGTVVFLALKLGRPLFLEGEAGVGKTEIAKALASGLGRRLIRLQCYEGLDASSAVYEWNFPAQMVAIRTAEASGGVNAASLNTHGFRPKSSASVRIDRRLTPKPDRFLHPPDCERTLPCMGRRAREIGCVLGCDSSERSSKILHRADRKSPAVRLSRRRLRRRSFLSWLGGVVQPSGQEPSAQAAALVQSPGSRRAA
jgi:hypothetical protein